MIKEVKVSDFTEVITGGTPSTTVKEYWEGGKIPWLNSGELNKKYIFESKNFITELGLKNSSTRMMPSETVLIALTGATCGLSGLSKIEACANQSVTGILPSKNHSSNYLLHYLRTQREMILRKAWGNAQPHISQQFVKDLLIPLPILSTQLHIANILSKAENLIAQRKESITLLDEFLKSIFLEMFGNPAFNRKNWSRIKFKDLITKGDKINYGIVQPGEDGKKEGIAIVRVGDFEGTKINSKNLKLVDPIVEQKHKASRLIGDEVLIACVGATIGKIALADISHKGKNIVRAIARVRCDSQKLNRLYLCQLLLTSFYQFNLKILARTIAQPTLNIGQIEELKIIVPPLLLQNQFAQILEKIETLKAQYQSSLQELENLYGSLSQKAFKGELNFYNQEEEGVLMAAEDEVKYPG